MAFKITINDWGFIFVWGRLFVVVCLFVCFLFWVVVGVFFWGGGFVVVFFINIHCCNLFS